MSNHSEYHPIVHLKARMWHNRQSREVETKGQVAKALLALAHAGTQGVTSLEISSWAYRFSAYVYDLRHDYKLDIQMLREEHPGGWHGRYILHTPVEILEVTYG